MCVFILHIIHIPCIILTQRSSKPLLLSLIEVDNGTMFNYETLEGVDGLPQQIVGTFKRHILSVVLPEGLH